MPNTLSALRANISATCCSAGMQSFADGLLLAAVMIAFGNLSKNKSVERICTNAKE